MKKYCVILLLMLSLPLYAQNAPNFMKVRQIDFDGFYFTRNAGVFAMDGIPHMVEMTSQTMISYETRFRPILFYRLQAGVTTFRSDLDSYQNTSIAPSVGAFFGYLFAPQIANGRFTAQLELGDIVSLANLGGTRFIHTASVGCRPNIYLTPRLGVSALLRVPVFWNYGDYKAYKENRSEYEAMSKRLSKPEGANKWQIGIGLMYQL